MENYGEQGVPQNSQLKNSSNEWKISLGFVNFLNRNCWAINALLLNHSVRFTKKNLAHKLRYAHVWKIVTTVTLGIMEM